MKSRDKVAIGWIDPGVVDGLFAWSVIDLRHRRSDRIGQILRVEGGLISRQRNEIVAAFLNSGCEWLFMVDSDEKFTVEDFDKLVATAHATERPFVAGVYFGTFPGPDVYPTPVPLIFRKAADGRTRYTPLDDFPANTVIPVDAAGTGCLLVHRSVFEAIREARATEHTGADWCWFLDLPVNGEWFGEDLYFCRAVETLGFPMVAHTGVILGHRKRYWLDASHHERYKLLTTRKADADDAG